MTSFEQRISPAIVNKDIEIIAEKVVQEKLTNLSNLVKHENAQNSSAISPGEDSNAKQCWAIETRRLVTRDKR